MFRFAMRITVFALFVVALVTAQAGSALAQDDYPYLVPLDHPQAAFLESRAYAAAMGATDEFRKMEWVAYDPVNNRVYWAMSEIGKGMSDGEGDIQLEENLCGAVYMGDLDADNNITKLTPVVVGGPFDEAAEENQCDVNNVANPDGLAVDSLGRLWIAEDTSFHTNNALWMWDGAELHRFATVPVGAEVTGTWFAPDGSLFFNAQHPSGMNLYPFNRGVIGVVNGFKATDDFTAMEAPAGADMHRVVTAAGEYQVLGRTGIEIPNDIYGQRFGQIIRLDDSLQHVCNAPDGNMYLPVDEAGTEGYLYTNFECQPGAISKLYIRNNGSEWEVLEGVNVDFSEVNGTWNNCGSTVTPWNTALTAEEYEPLAVVADNEWKENIAPMSDYLGETANPYDYGWLVEMIPDPDGDMLNSLIVKHFALGRFSHENAVVLPDEQTIYHGDDGTNVVFFKSVLAEPGDMSAATLYAAKVTQLEDGSLELEWIELGSSTNDDIAAAIDELALPE